MVIGISWFREETMLNHVNASCEKLWYPNAALVCFSDFSVPSLVNFKHVK